MTPWRLIAAISCYAASIFVPEPWLWGWADVALITAAGILWMWGLAQPNGRVE